jgi:multiple sugar transport system ATP-binding protein
VTVGLRPESLRLVSANGEPDGGQLDLVVELVEELGADAFVYGSAGVGHRDGNRPVRPSWAGAADSLRLTIRVDGRKPPTPGQRIRVAVRDLNEIHLFHPIDGARIGTAAG